MRDDYDQLSVLGYEQCRALGTHLARAGHPIGALVCGPLKRHQQSMHALCEGLSAAGVTPQTVADEPALDEYAALEVMQRVVPELVQADPQVAGWVEGMFTPGKPGMRNRELLFQHVTRAWISGDIQVSGVETFSEFRTRVAEGLQRLMGAAQSGQTVLAMTSGGAIAAAVGRAFDLSDSNVFELSLVIRNASNTEFLFSGERFSLFALNLIPHLTDPAQITFR